MKVPKSLKREIGILGGGQLARMLAESAHRLGLRPVVYTDEAKCPAADIAAETITAELSNTKKLKAFVKRTEFVAFENEFVDCSLLKKTGQSLTTKFYPRLSAIELLQDKLAQKKLFKKLNLPSSPFIEVRQKRDIVRALEELEGDIVLKWSRQGYDGKGVKVVPRSQAEAGEGFFDLAIKRKIPVYAEKRIDFIRELAMIGCRSITGEFANYPLVISKQESGICKEVVGPACHLGVSKNLELLAIECVKKIGIETQLVGSYGVEMFETRDGELLINEVAPRVHNTGHYTQNAFPVSQFENHLRAILGIPLFQPGTDVSSGNLGHFFVMLNLLGPEGVTRKASQSPLPVPGPNTQLHWYAKEEIRPGRKLGHLNGVANSPEALSALLKELKVCEEEWVKGLRSK